MNVKEIRKLREKEDKNKLFFTLRHFPAIHQSFTNIEDIYFEHNDINHPKLKPVVLLPVNKIGRRYSERIHIKSNRLRSLCRSSLDQINAMKVLSTNLHTARRERTPRLVYKVNNQIEQLKNDHDSLTSVYDELSKLGFHIGSEDTDSSEINKLGLTDILGIQENEIITKDELKDKFLVQLGISVSKKDLKLMYSLIYDKPGITMS